MKISIDIINSCHLYFFLFSAVLSYLNITLPSQQLSPDAQMGRESLLTKVENLVDIINATKSSVNQGSDNVDGIVAAQPDGLYLHLFISYSNHIG